MKLNIISLSIILLFFITACSDSEKKVAKELEKKQAKLEKLLDKSDKLADRIKDLEEEIAKLDSTETEEFTNVVIETAEQSYFEHYIEVQGVVQSNENILISAELAGTITAVLVEAGQKVTQGQMLIRMDGEIIEKNISELKTSLDLFTALFNKQKNLWDQKIGSEIEYLRAKNNKETLEHKLRTAQSQLAKTMITAPINGTVDETFINKGEMAVPGMQLVRVVNLKDIKVVSDVSEAYVGKIKPGDSVVVNFPSLDMQKKAIVNSVGRYIKPANRTFKVEVMLANANELLIPNLLAGIFIRDYMLDSAVVIPTKLIQQSSKGDYIYVVKEEEEDMVARRVLIQSGKSYNGSTVVEQGLIVGDEYITVGFTLVSEGETVTITK